MRRIILAITLSFGVVAAANAGDNNIKELARREGASLFLRANALAAHKDFELSSMYNKDFVIGAAVALAEQHHIPTALFWDYFIEFSKGYMHASAEELGR
jgi:hypothetical protein